ncbi:hypothetical protein [Parasitella parasitica]|uniref:ATP-dependent DNA helicase n=1 Tax=Parasitella parasitica TaxID=35722 RepID=A0A0B7NW67_9FUNG|nr:hypothetical protein [Parasitella parasitica]
MEHDSATFISGAAGTGKSFVLGMLERHYRLKGFKMAPNGVAAHNIAGQTLHRFFGMTNESSVHNFQVLDEHVKLYSKLLLLMDEYSMLSAEMLDISYQIHKRSHSVKKMLANELFAVIHHPRAGKKANEKDYANFQGEGHKIEAIDSFSGAREGTTRAAL